MPRIKFYLPALLCVIALGLWVPYESRSQVGQSQLVNPDLASEKELLALPHMTGVIVKSILAQRPFLNMADLHALLSKTLSKEQSAELYGRMFVQIRSEERRVGKECRL